MLEQLTITGGACFGNGPLVLNGFKKANFFFGSNGSGKTTISRALAGYENLSYLPVWSDGSPLKVKVYNRDFVDRMLKESSRIPGVFVIGKKSVEAETRLQEIESENGERAKAADALSRSRSSLASAQEANEEAQTTFRDIAWRSYQQLITDHPSLKSAFTGQGGVGKSKQVLMDKLLALGASSETMPSLESLTKDAEAVFDTTSTTYATVPKTTPFSMKSFNGYELLGERIVGSNEVSLSELISHLGNSNWVSEGRHFLEHSGGVCPFCQEKAPEKLLSDLAAIFDDEYTTKKVDVEDFADALAAWSNTVSDAAAGLDDSARAFLDDAAYQTAMVILRTEIDANLAVLEQKKQNLSAKVAVSSLDALVEELDRIIEAANTAIIDHNDLINNRRTERPKLVAKCWQYLAFELLSTNLSIFKKKQTGREGGIATLTKNVADAEDVIADLNHEVRQLQSSVRSTQPVIDRINAVLQRSGFTSFEIVPSPQLADGYMLSRGDNAVQEHSLSEGERTFIAFLYFFHLLDEEADENDKSHRILAVIDDPVSSLDSDVLFVVGALVRNVIARVFRNDDHIEQVLVLTHNVYFHKDVSHIGNGESEGGRTYFVIRKRHDVSSEVVPHRSNPITTEYRRLWDEVKHALSGEQINVVGLENILRRILESYFRVMGGGIWDDQITPLLDQSEQHVYKALFRWANEGSHSILEEVYYSPTPINQGVYLEVFKRIFEVTDQGAHYRMMIDGRQSLPPMPSEVAD